MPGPARGAAGQRPLVAAGAGVWRALWGANPWPAAGWWGAGSAAAMLLAALAYVLSQVASGGYGAPEERFFGNDLVAYLTGTALLLRGDALFLYDPARQLAAQQALMDALGLPTRGMEYVNPPLWAALLVVLFPLGVYGADLAWRVLLVVGSAAALWWLVPRSTAARRSALLLLGFFPFVQGWHHRSMVVVLLASFAGWVALAGARRPFVAGLALSGLFLKPQYALFPLLALAYRRQWRQLQGAAIGGLLQGVATLLLMLSPGQLPSLEAVARFAQFGGADSGAVIEAQVNLRAAILHLLPGADAGIQLALLLALTPLAVGAVLWLLGGRRRAPGAGPFGAWEVLAIAAATNLTAPYNHITGLVLLLVPAALLLCQGEGSREAEALSGRRHGARAALAAALALPSLGILLAPLSVWLYVLAGWAVALAALALGVWQARRPTGPPLGDVRY